MSKNNNSNSDSRNKASDKHAHTTSNSRVVHTGVDANDAPKSVLSLLPLLLFLTLFLGTGIAYSMQGAEYAFYQLPAHIAILPAIILAIAIGKFLSKSTIDSQLQQFIEGAGHPNIITMGIIYLLAGAFAAIAKTTGSVDATVLFGLSLFPDYLILPGIFIISALLSLAMGTSMGTIAAIAPIALGFIEVVDMNAGVMAGCIISGAIFGDNLSIISDTTIASTRSQGANMKDKFAVNFSFAVPAAIICLVIFFAMGQTLPLPSSTELDTLALLPYAIILFTALLGINVFLVLVLGIISAAFIGYTSAEYSLTLLINDINNGFKNVQEIFILALFIGGLSELIRQQGGLALLSEKIMRAAKKLSPNNKQRAASIGIAAVAFFCNLFTANNTVSIIVTGDTAKSIANDNDIPPAHSASLLDVFSCISQGILPYGAQALLLGATLAISPIDVVSYAFYPMILLCSAGFAFWRFSKK